MESTEYYVVKKKAVPEVLLSVVKAKRLLESGRVMTIQEAVDQVGISRSSFYKYKDDYFAFIQKYTAYKKKISDLKKESKKIRTIIKKGQRIKPFFEPLQTFYHLQTSTFLKGILKPMHNRESPLK